MTEKSLRQTKSEQELRNRMLIGSDVKSQKFGYSEQELRKRMQSESIETVEEIPKVENITIEMSSEQALRKRMMGELESPSKLIETPIPPDRVESITGGTQSEQELRKRMQLELTEPPNLIETASTFISQLKEAPETKEKEKTDIERKVEKIDHELNRFRRMGWGEYIGSGGGLDPNKISAHLIPTTANTYDLGSSDWPWRDVHLSGATLVIGGTELAAGELTVLDNVTNGTVSASKAVIVDSDKDITGFRNVNAVSYSINGTAVTSTAAELNIMDGDTSASSTTLVAGDKAIVNDGGVMKQVALSDLETYVEAALDTLPNVTSVGTLTALTVDNVAINGTTIGHTSDTDLLTLADGVVTVAGELSATTIDIGGTNISATATELNLMDGVTATTSELNLLDVSTASGASSSTFLRGDGSWQAITGQGHTIQNAGSNLSSRTGLNFDGTYLIATDDSGNNQTDVALHSTLQGLASVTSTAAELNKLDGATVTTAEINILDGVTATAAELNINDGATLTTDEINLLDISTAPNASTSTFLRGDGSWQSPTGGGASLAFKTISVNGQSNVVADDTADTLTLIASGDTTITTNAGNDSITIDTTVTTVDGGNF